MALGLDLVAFVAFDLEAAAAAWDAFLGLGDALFFGAAAVLLLPVLLPPLPVLDRLLGLFPAWAAAATAAAPGL